ncbi:hypothetical protein PAXINDRAFT_81587, partial [Paxillus involutus ATCC 200175]
SLLASIRRTECKFLETLPTFLERRTRSKAPIEELKKLGLVVSGPLSMKTGDALCAAGVVIESIYRGRVQCCCARARQERHCGL